MTIKLIAVMALILGTFPESFQGKSKLYEAKRLHKAVELLDQDVKQIAILSDMVHFNTVLDEILIPRVVGTPGHKKVANYIVKTMEDLGWHVERDTFKDRAPIFGELEFENIIAKLNPDAHRFLFLACHYDSKYTREKNFVGATDSAVPCAMMINLAKVMQEHLNSIKTKNDVSLALLFFDGEEAFRQWGPKDSIYGARHLASRWEKEEFLVNNDNANHLDRMDILVLLDLLGTAGPKFYSYFPATERWYVRLSDAEERLHEMGELRGYQIGAYDPRYFMPRSVGAHIEDDHIPFLKRDVAILHVIPTPFPDVWHKPSDNKSALDMDTIEDLNKIFRVFVSEYLHLNL